MNYRHRLEYTQELQDELIDRWTEEIEADGWPEADVQRDIEKIKTVSVGTVITWLDDDSWPEDDISFDGSQYTSEQLIVTGYFHYGFLPHVAYHSMEKIDS